MDLKLNFVTSHSLISLCSIMGTCESNAIDVKLSGDNSELL